MLDLNVERAITRDCNLFFSKQWLNRSQLENSDVSTNEVPVIRVNGGEATQNPRGIAKGRGVDEFTEWNDLILIGKYSCIYKKH